VQDGCTAMLIAAQKGDEELIRVLAGLGGDVNKALAVSAWHSAVCRLMAAEH